MGGCFDTSLKNLLATRENKDFILIVDEASLISQTELISAMYLLKPYSVFLIGDHEQFSPYPFEAKLNELEDRSKASKMIDDFKEQKQIDFYNKSLFEEKINLPYDTVCLNTNYRNHWIFVELAQYFYKDIKLTAAKKNMPLYNDTLDISNTENKKGFEEKKIRLLGDENAKDKDKDVSFENEGEARWIIDKIKNIPGQYSVNDVTIITPYKGQLALIRKKIDEDVVLKDRYSASMIEALKNRVITMRPAEGLENKIVFVSLVRTSSNRTSKRKPIVADSSLLLVSLTRATDIMGVIGNKKALSDLSLNPDDEIENGMYDYLFDFGKSLAGNEKMLRLEEGERITDRKEGVKRLRVTEFIREVVPVEGDKSITKKTDNKVTKTRRKRTRTVKDEEIIERIEKKIEEIANDMLANGLTIPEIIARKNEYAKPCGYSEKDFDFYLNYYGINFNRIVMGDLDLMNHIKEAVLELKEEIDKGKKKKL